MTPSDGEVTIREFVAGDEGAFRRLNEEWIHRYFSMEAKDEEALSDPWGSIIHPGGRIFLAIRDGQPVGCCALVAAHPGDFEVVKMAVTESCQKSGIGRKLLARVIAEARAAGAERLHLETNGRLTPAIRLYESLGFTHIPPERIPPSPYVRAEVFMELLLQQPMRMPV